MLQLVRRVVDPRNLACTPSSISCRVGPCHTDRLIAKLDVDALCMDGKWNFWKLQFPRCVRKSLALALILSVPGPLCRIDMNVPNNELETA